MKKIVLFALIVLPAVFSLAQNNLPDNIKNAIPSNYTVVDDQYYNSGIIASATINLKIEGDNACDKGLEDSVSVEIIIQEMRDNYVVQMQEEQVPFSDALPTKESLRFESDENGFLVYDEPQVIDVDGGRLVYCKYTVKCIMSENESFEGVHIIALQGSYARQVSVELGGPISSDKGIRIVKSLLGTFSTINL